MTLPIWKITNSINDAYDIRKELEPYRLRQLFRLSRISARRGSITNPKGKFCVGNTSSNVNAILSVGTDR